MFARWSSWMYSITILFISITFCGCWSSNDLAGTPQKVGNLVMSAFVKNFMTIVRLSYSHYNDCIAFSSSEHTNWEFDQSHLFELPFRAFGQIGLPFVLCDAANFFIRYHHYMHRVMSIIIGLHWALWGTHLRCTSLGSSASCIQSASSSNIFFSSSPFCL